jgi:hypothetical protein
MTIIKMATICEATADLVAVGTEQKQLATARLA